MRYIYTIETIDGPPPVFIVRENTEEKKVVFQGSICEVEAWINLQSKAQWI